MVIFIIFNNYYNIFLDKVPNSFFLEFSFIESIKTLLKYDKNNELNFFYTTKAMTIIPVIYGHKVFVLMSNPISNSKFIDNVS